jgi:hypothetical protein
MIFAIRQGLANMNIAPYSGECMAPWGPGDTSVLYVKEMLANAPFPIS